ncbi:hypothetical protein CLU79DRAFT_760940 [Phycomyces nitens]|nr:hypothetical protein CLU79DRAFT_760940 [Phycomyces nitens]
MQAPVILERPNRIEPTQSEPVNDQKQGDQPRPAKPEEIKAVLPFFKRQTKFQIDTVLKCLGDHPGHFVIGVVGQQGVGKSTLLSSLMHDTTEGFATQNTDLLAYEGHKTLGIDMHITPERTILLDTEPILSWSVMDRALRTGGLEGLPPDIWVEMESLYQLVFMLSVCNVVMIVSEGSEVDSLILQCLKRAEMLKVNLPEFPLIPLSSLTQDPHYVADIVFVGNKCQDLEFTWRHYRNAQNVLKSGLAGSSLKVSGLVSLGYVLPAFDIPDPVNLFFLPTTQPASGIESFDILMASLRDQVMAAPRRAGKRGQVSEKDWFRNSVKTYELIRKSEHFMDYLKMVRKLRDG